MIFLKSKFESHDKKLSRGINNLFDLNIFRIMEVRIIGAFLQGFTSKF